ncbi:MAG: NADH:ubiquinone oxidoreductase subunit NDUFA12 [Paracoccaceae bacterium]
MDFLKRFFGWWSRQTFGTQLFTWRKGQLVGEDERGNKYYRTADDGHRWAIFNGEIEASVIPPGWHGWLHRVYNEPPTEKPLDHKPWEKPHQENLSGTALAYHPPGSLYSGRPAARIDYEAWQPE